MPRAELDLNKLATTISELRDARLIFIGLGLSILFWFLEALVHVAIFNDSDLVEQIFAPPAHEIWMRLMVICMFAAFGFYAHRVVDARRRVEEAVRLAHAELAQIFETAADGMRVVDKDFRVLKANDMFARLVGMPKQAILGKKCYEVFRGPLCDTPSCPLTKILNHEEPVEYNAEKERSDGARIPCIVTATPFKRPNGEVIGIVEDFKDISERRWSE
jgi:PAS domain S-box-containing protein